MFSLPGLERVRLFTRRLIPTTSFSRLVGFRIGHVSTGSLTGTMRAGSHLLMVPDYNIAPLFGEAFTACVATAVDAGMTSSRSRSPRSTFGGHGRSRKTSWGERVVNASSVFVSMVAELEDPVGRLVGSATSQWAVRPVDPPPRSPPASIEPIEEATYATPDPPDRPPVGGLPPPEATKRFNGLELARMVISGELPPIPQLNTFGARWLRADEGIADFAMPASEWLSFLDRNVSPGGLESLLGMASSCAAVTMENPGQTLAVLHLNALPSADARRRQGADRIRQGASSRGQPTVGGSRGDRRGRQHACRAVVCHGADRPQGARAE